MVFSNTPGFFNMLTDSHPVQIFLFTLLDIISYETVHLIVCPLTVLELIIYLITISGL